jgi:multidrug resistance efflux pump
MTRKRAWILIGLVAVVLAGSAIVSVVRALNRMGGEDIPTFVVERGDFVRRVYADGNLEAAQATLLSAPPTIRGPVNIAWLAPDGSHVSAGDVVVRFDPSDMEQKLREGRSDQATAESRISQKKVREDGAIRNLGRDADIAVMDLEHAEEFQSLDPTIFSRVDIVESEIDHTLAGQRKEHAETVRGIREELAGVELDLLAIERRKAELQITQAEEDLQKLEVRAPHAGIFTLKEVWGDVPQVGSTIWGGNPVAEIPQLDEMEARIFVLEADAGGLAVGLEATVLLDAHPDRTYAATVKKVDALAKRRNRRVPVQYFGVTLELAATDREIMKPGQRVQAEVILEQLEQVLTVPRQAVFEKDDASVVYVRRDGGFEATAVQLGAAALGRVVVEDGLDAGDLVALRDPTRPLAGPDSGTDEGEGATATPARAGL